MRGNWFSVGGNWILVGGNWISVGRNWISVRGNWFSFGGNRPTNGIEWILTHLSPASSIEYVWPKFQF